MNIKTFGILGLFLVLLASAGFAIQGTITSESHKIDQHLISAGGATISSEGFTSSCSVGDPTVASVAFMTDTNHQSSAGFQSTLLSPEAAVVSNVRIENVSFEGKAVINNDYIQPNAVITATVTAAGSTINTNTSQIVIDGAAVTFASLSPPSSYTGSALTYNITPNLTDGTHIISIEARDQLNNFNSYSRTLQVDTGALKATSVFIYPNPYNPNAGPATIAYNLSKDGNTSIYIFNAIGELIYRQDYPNDKAGYVEQLWNGTDFAGNVLANDVYFLRVVSGGEVIGKCKIAIIK
jgi:hypothetical protein